jgi:hypothetical protein
MQSFEMLQWLARSLCPALQVGESPITRLARSCLRRHRPLSTSQCTVGRPRHCSSISSSALAASCSTVTSVIAARRRRLRRSCDIQGTAIPGVKYLLLTWQRWQAEGPIEIVEQCNVGAVDNDCCQLICISTCMQAYATVTRIPD